MGAVTYYWPTSEKGTLYVARHERTTWDKRGKRVRQSLPARSVTFADYRYKTSDVALQRAIEATGGFTHGQIRRLDGRPPEDSAPVAPATLGLIADVLARLPALPAMDDDEFDPFGD